MFCKKCGFKLDDDANFCPKCGTTVSDSIKERLGGTSQTNSQKSNNILVENSDRDKYILYHTELHNKYKSEALRVFNTLNEYATIAADVGEATVVPLEDYKGFERKLDKAIDILNTLIYCMCDSDETVAKCGDPHSHDSFILMGYWNDLLKLTGRIKDEVISFMTGCLDYQAGYWEAEEFANTCKDLKQAFLGTFITITPMSYKLYDTINDESFDMAKYVVERERFRKRLEIKLKYNG